MYIHESSFSSNLCNHFLFLYYLTKSRLRDSFTCGVAYLLRSRILSDFIFYDTSLARLLSCAPTPPSLSLDDSVPIGTVMTGEMAIPPATVSIKSIYLAANPNLL